MDGSDLLDSPLAFGQTSQISTSVSSGIRSGSWQFPHSQTSFSDALKAPLRTMAKRRPTSHGKGFALSADDFPVLFSKDSQSGHQQAAGHSFQGRPTFSSVIIAPARRKIPLTAGSDPVSTTNWHKGAQQAQIHATQTPLICMPPPCIDYWHPPPDHPPDRGGISHEAAASYNPCKPADMLGHVPAQSFAHSGQSLLSHGGEIRHGQVHDGYSPENNGFCPAHVPDDTSVKTLPHLILRKVKNDHSNALEKQPFIKKDVALLEKIKCLNIKARRLRALNMSEISLCRESKVEQSESNDVKSDHVANGVPFSPVTGDITSAFDMANSVSESSEHVPISTLNVSANLAMSDLSEGHVTESSEARKLGKSADNHVYGVWNTSRNRHGTSVTDTASDIWEDGWEEHSPVTMINNHEDQPFAANSSQQVHVHGTSATDTVYDILGDGWEEHLPVTVSNIHEDQPFAESSSQQVHVREANDILKSPHYEIQLSRRELSTEQIGRNGASQSHENSAPKHLQMENRQRQACSQERVLKDRSNIAESKENIATFAVTLVDTQRTEAKCHVDLSTQTKMSRPVSSCKFDTEKTLTEASGVHKSHISGVIINRSIIPVQAVSVRGFTVGSIMLGDSSLTSLNREEKTESEKVHDYTTDRSAGSKQTKQSGKNQYAEDPHGSDSVMCTQVKEPCMKEEFEAVGLNCMIMPASTQPSGNQSIGLQNMVLANTSEAEGHISKPTYKELHLQNLFKMLPAEQLVTLCDNSSTPIVQTKSHDKEAVDTSTTVEDEANTECENQVDEIPSSLLVTSTTSLNHVTTNGSASVGQDLTEYEASSLVLKMMHELSEQLDQVEKQLESITHVPALNRSQPTQMASLPGYTRAEHFMSLNERKYLSSGRGNLWIDYAANNQMGVSGMMIHGAADLPTSHVSAGPFTVPQNNMLDGNSTLEWMWDAAEGQLISDIGSIPDLSTSNIERRGCEPTENVYSVGQMDLYSLQAMRGMAYRDAAMTPEIRYHTGPELECLNPAWFPRGQHDGRDLGSSSGTGVYLLGMDLCYRERGTWPSSAIRELSFRNGNRNFRELRPKFWRNTTRGNILCAQHLSI